MPTYEYVCKSCGHAFEEFQSMMEDPLVRCPQCGTEALMRILGSGAAVIFKGSGFYLTDYKKTSPSATREEKKPSGESPKDVAPKKEKGSEGKTKDDKKD
jgi:putative FmdB family regulatory protein